MKKMLPLLLLALLSCEKTDGPIVYNRGLIGKWRMYESLSDPGDGSGKWRSVKPADTEILEFRVDSTLQIVRSGTRTGFFYNASQLKFLVRGKQVYFYTSARPVPDSVRGTRFEMTPTYTHLRLDFPCDEACAARYVAIH